MFVFIFLFLSFQNFALCFLSPYVRWKPRLLLQTIGRLALQLEEKGFSCFAKEGKKKKSIPQLVHEDIWEKVLVLSRLTYIRPQKEFTLSFGTYKLLTWKKKKEKLHLNQRQTWKTNAPSPSPISLQRYKICMFWEVVSSMLWGSLKLWNAINRVLLNPHSKKDSQSPQFPQFLRQ